jgi:DNA-binding Lrp family transcriptional regulator
MIDINMLYRNLKEIKGNTMLTLSSLKRIQSLMEEYNLLFNCWDIEELYINLGYPSLTPGDRETYFVLKKLAKQKNNTKIRTCVISVEYLALMLNTSEEGQISRLKNLKREGLIESSKRIYNYNMYYLPVVKPTKFFAKCIIHMIRKKRIESLMLEYKKAKSVESKLQLSQVLLTQLQRYKKYKDFKTVKTKIESILHIKKQRKQTNQIQKQQNNKIVRIS